MSAEPAYLRRQALSAAIARDGNVVYAFPGVARVEPAAAEPSPAAAPIASPGRRWSRRARALHYVASFGVVGVVFGGIILALFGLPG